MLLPALAIIGSIAFVFLTRLYWGPAPAQGETPLQQRTLVRVAIAALVLTLLVLIASGRVHWLSAAAAGALPFLRRALSLLRFAPFLARLWPQVRSRTGRPQGRGGALTVDEARAILEVPSNASEEVILAAHRRLMNRNHPDKGGSSYIAAQLNNARDLLLDQLRS